MKKTLAKTLYLIILANAFIPGPLQAEQRQIEHTAIPTQYHDLPEKMSPGSTFAGGILTFTLVAALLSCYCAAAANS